MSVSNSANISSEAIVSSSARIWDNVQIRERAWIGENVVLGKDSYVGIGVEVGDNCKIQNGAQIYEPARLAKGVFVGPGAILTNDRAPRAVMPDLEQKTSDDWTSSGVTVGEGASIGAGAICVAPLKVGKWALIAAGAVVTKDVPDFALVAGVPGERIGWVGQAGQRLKSITGGGPNEIFECPTSGKRYEQKSDNALVELE